MAVARSAIRGSVRFRIEETTAAYWTEIEINEYINKAKDDLYNAICLVNEDFFLESEDIAVVAGDYKVAMAANYFRTKTLRCTTSGYEDIIFSRKDHGSNEFKSGLNSSLVVSNPANFLYDISCDITNQRHYLHLSPIVRNSLTIKHNYIAMIADISTAAGAGPDALTFPIQDTFVGYIVDRAAGYALKKGPSGDFKTCDNDAAGKLAMILTNVGRRNLGGHEFVEGFMED